MNEVFEAVALADKDVLARMAQKVLDSTTVEVLKQQSGMIMAQARESVEGLVFNLGEVYVSEAEVKIGDFLGYSMVLGGDGDKARFGAILDAAVNSGHPISEEILQVLHEQKSKDEDRRARLWAAVKSTRVDFEVMH